MKKYTLIGSRLTHSYSAAIHKRFFELNNINADYTLTETEPCALGSLIFKLSDMGFAGANVTVPFKTAVMGFLTDISAEAQRIGAVNTIVFDGRDIRGFNTDYMGFEQTLKRYSVQISNRDIVILGTGGASKAVCEVCVDNNARSITFVSRTPQKSGEYEVLSYSDCIRGDVLINATPVGMHPEVDRSPLAAVPDTFGTVIDVIYNPCKTRLLELAENIGAHTVNGLYMLVSQAMYSQSIWRSVPYDDSITQTIFNELSDEFEKR